MIKNKIISIYNVVPLIVWLPALFMALYVKLNVLHINGYKFIASLINRKIGADFSFFENITLFRSDLLICGIVIPILLLFFINRTKNFKYKLQLVLILNIFFIIFLFVELQCYKMTGNLIKLDSLLDGIKWGIRHPHFMSSYVNTAAIVKLSMILIISLTLVLTLYFLYSLKTRIIFFRLHTIVIGFWTLLIVFTLIAWIPILPATWFHKSIFLQAVNETIISAIKQSQSKNYKTLDELSSSYQSLTNSAGIDQKKELFGLAKGYDLIFFILETLPYRNVNMGKNIDDLPNLKLLSQNAWIAERHYTTYPATGRSHFSILTSMYPINPNVYFKESSKKTPGLINDLNHIGYKSRLYVPHAFENLNEEKMFNSLGFDEIIIGDPDMRSTGYGDDYIDYAIKLDRQVLERMKNDIFTWVNEGNNYATVYAPQIGHAPWPDILKNGTAKSEADKCRNIMILQDTWIGEVISLLSIKGTLDRTLIIITGDHGIRTANEDPSFNANGRLNEYTFHVPLLFYCPKILKHRIDLSWVTSHIDIVPSIFNLLGVTSYHKEMWVQGMAIWDEKIALRTTYFSSR